MSEAPVEFQFPDRPDPIAGLELQPPRLQGEARDDRDAIAILLCEQLIDAKGLHGETLLTVVGALTGCAAAVAVAECAAEQSLPLESVFQIVETKTGGRFRFSDAVNRLLFEGVDEWSDLWSLLAALAQAMEQPVNEEAPRTWARHFAASLGGKAEGQPILLEGQFQSRVSAFDAVRRFWPPVEALLTEGGGDRLEQYGRLMLLAVALVATLAEVVPVDAAASHILQASIAGAKLPLDDRLASLFELAPPLPRPGEQADLSRIADPHFPYAPAWSSAPKGGSVISAVLADMDGGNAATVQAVDHAPAPFWNGAGILWRGWVTSGCHRAGRLYVLQINQEVFLLSFVSDDLDQIAATRPPGISDAGIAADWFRFRLGFGGPLARRPRLIESVDQLCLDTQLTDDAAIGALITPLAATRTAEGWKSRATLLVDDQLALVELFQADTGAFGIHALSKREELVRVPALRDPFASLLVGPFIPDVFPMMLHDEPEPAAEPPVRIGRAMQLPWREADADQRAAFLSFLADAGCPLPAAAAECGIRHTALAFYPRLVLCEITATETDERLYVLIDPDGGETERCFVLDQTNGPIFAANASHLVLNADSAVAYVAFFFSVMTGPYGSMPLLESLEDVGDLKDEHPSAFEALASVVPPSPTVTDADGFTVDAAMLFRDAIFKATIRALHTGEVSILRHEMLLSFDVRDSSTTTPSVSRH